MNLLSVYCTAIQIQNGGTEREIEKLGITVEWVAAFSSERTGLSWWTELLAKAGNKKNHDSQWNGQCYSTTLSHTVSTMLLSPTYLQWIRWAGRFISLHYAA